MIEYYMNKYGFLLKLDGSSAYILRDNRWVESELAYRHITWGETDVYSITTEEALEIMRKR